MKKTALLILTIGILTACQNNHKKNTHTGDKTHTMLQTNKWILDQKASSIQWTGYKTTVKTPVKGVFKSFKIANMASVNDLNSAIKQAQVEINAFSVFSNNEDRDKKLATQLFGQMIQSQIILAEVVKTNPNKQTALVKIKMNNHEKEIPMQLIIDEDKGQVNISGQIDLTKDFDAGKALQIFHQACFDQHTGTDGVSKTWPIVEVMAQLVFKKK